MTSTIRCGGCGRDRGDDQLVDDDGRVVPCPGWIAGSDLPCSSTDVAYHAAPPRRRLVAAGTTRCGRCGVAHTVYEVAPA